MDKAKLKNIPSGSDGKGYITLNGEVLPAFLIRKVSANIGMIVESKRFLGDRMKQNAVRGMEGKGNITYDHASSAFIKAIKEYQQTGVYPSVTVQYYTESTEYGRCEVTLRDVIFNEIGLGMLEDDSDQSQSFDTAFTFDDFDLVEGFK